MMNKQCDYSDSMDHFALNNEAASSAIIEDYFKGLKNHQGYDNATNANKFALAHNAVLQTEIKLAMSEIKRCELENQTRRF